MEYAELGWQEAVILGCAKQEGILVRAANRATIDEEMPEAYKDATEVVDTTDGAGIGKKVARLRPLIVVKG